MDIRLFGDPVLRERAREVTRFDQALRRLADDMTETMRRAQGVGLAGNQVGVLKRIFVYTHPGDDHHEAASGAWVNPEIIATSEEVQVGEEGCLSIPGLFYDVERPLEVTMRAQDLDGEVHTCDYVGYMARIALHEIDHLNGILFLDHLERHLKKDAMRRVRAGEVEEHARARAEGWLRDELDDQPDATTARVTAAAPDERGGGPPTLGS